MPKLTDTQLVILSAAARRDNSVALPLPRSLKIKGAAVTRTLDGLLTKGLLAEKPASRNAPAWRDAEDGRRMMLVITDAGRQAIDGGPAGQRRKRAAPAKGRGGKPAKRPARKAAASKLRSKPSAPTAVRQGTKQALLIDLLKRKAGATIDEIVAATGWQAHSVRGAISGALKKKLGLTVESEKVEGRGRVYRIVSMA